MKLLSNIFTGICLFVALGLSSCSQINDGKEAPVQNESSPPVDKTVQNGSSAPVEKIDESKLVYNSLSCKPVQISQEVKKSIYWLDTDKLANEEEYEALSLAKIYSRGMCITSTDLFNERKNLPKYFLFIGNHDGVGNVSKIMDLTIKKIGQIASLLGRSFCFVEGNKNFLNLAADREDIEFMAWIGHGTDGNLVGLNTDELITPESIKVFKSKILRQVNIISCKAGLKKNAWQSKFGKNVNLQLSTEDIPVIDGLTLLGDGLAEDQLASCKYLNK